MSAFSVPSSHSGVTAFHPPTTVYGVDFSGARRAGDSTYLAEATADGDGLRVESVAAVPARLGTDAARESVLPALRSFVAEAGPRAAFGLDFSFGFPAFLLDAAHVADGTRSSAGSRTASRTRARSPTGLGRWPPTETATGRTTAARRTVGSAPPRRTTSS